MFYAVIKTPETVPTARLYFDVAQFLRDTFRPDDCVLCAIRFVVRGNTFSKKQDYLRNLAVDWQAADAEFQGGGLSCGEYAEITAWFAKMGKRYGLLREFRENGVC